MTKFLDKDIHDLAKKIASKVYEKNSAFRSSFIVKLYKKLGGKFEDTGDNIDDKPLKRWLLEDWKDYAPTIGEKPKYPVYRPTKRITNETPKTVKEISKKRLKEQYVEKQKIKGKKNLKPF